MINKVALTLLVALIGVPGHASVLLLGENPGQYAISVHIDNDSES
jgi:hypothetical protein